MARAFFRMVNLLSPPDALFQDQEIMKKAMEHWLARGKRPPEPLMGPPREELIAALRRRGLWRLRPSDSVTQLFSCSVALGVTGAVPDD